MAYHRHLEYGVSQGALQWIFEDSRAFLLSLTFSIVVNEWLFFFGDGRNVRSHFTRPTAMKRNICTCLQTGNSAVCGARYSGVAASNSCFHRTAMCARQYRICDNIGTSGRSRDSSVRARDWSVRKSIGEAEQTVRNSTEPTAGPCIQYICQRTLALTDTRRSGAA